jgi:HlyD family secretion protein
MSVRRSILVLTLLTLALPMVMFSSRAGQLQAENPVRNLQLYTVARGDVDVTITAIGDLQADQIAQLSFTKPGRVSELLVTAGDYVVAGDPLLKQDDSTERLAYDQANLALQAAQVDMQDVLDGPDAGDIRIAEANITSAWDSYNAIADAVSDEEIQAAQLRYEQAQQTYIDANTARRNAGSEHQEQITLLDAAIGEASFNMEIAHQQLLDLQNGNGPQLNAALARVGQAQAELERVQAGPTDTRIQSAQVAIDAAQTDLDQAASDLSLRTLTAPYDGIVSAVNVEVGALVAPGTSALELVDVDPLHANVEVDEIDIKKIREGMPAVVHIDALPDVDLPAALEKIALVGTSDQGIISYDVDVTLETADARVRTGMTAEAEIPVDSRQDVLIVPNAYIRLERRLNKAFVNVVQEDGTLKEVQIELGLQGTEHSEVLSGLREGDVIAVDTSGEGFSLFGG